MEIHRLVISTILDVPINRCFLASRFFWDVPQSSPIESPWEVTTSRIEKDENAPSWSLDSKSAPSCVALRNFGVEMMFSGLGVG